jgi:hypothetical protein
MVFIFMQHLQTIRFEFQLIKGDHMSFNFVLCDLWLLYSPSSKFNAMWFLGNPPLSPVFVGLLLYKNKSITIFC